MAVTGLFLIIFLLVHAFGNIKVFLGPEEFDHYAEWLKSDILYPLIPVGWFIWIFRAVMVAAMPSGVNSYLIAVQFNTGQALASNQMTIATALAALTTMFWLTVVVHVFG